MCGMLYKTLYHNSTLPTPAEIHSLRYFIMSDGICFTDAGIIRAITTAALSGALVSTMKMSDPSLSGVNLSGPPSLTAASHAPLVKPPLQLLLMSQLRFPVLYG